MGEKIQLQRILEKHVVLHLIPIDGMIQEPEKLTLISGVRASGRHARVPMRRIQKVFVKNGVTQEKTVIYIWIKVCLMGRMRRKEIKSDHGDLNWHRAVEG